MSCRRSVSSVVLLLGLGLLGAACAGMGRSAGPPGPPPTACSLLTRADVESVQGGSFKEAVPSGDTGQSLATTQCFFRVEPFTSSVNLTLTRAATAATAANTGGATGREVDERWERMFHREEHPGEEGTRGEREERERRKPPTRVEHLGREAFLSYGRGNVILYVLARGAFLSVSVGGPGKPEDWSRKAEALVRAALDRL